jgi:membrane protease YdiL (CAAX protease family)
VFTVLAWVRLQTGSIWPAIVLHAAYNSVIQSAFDPARDGEGSIWVGEEAGLLIAAVLVVAAVLVCRRPWRMLRAPGVPMEQAAVVSR